MRKISRFCLRVHTLKVEAAAWLEDGSCVCDQCPGEDEHVQNEVHALLICQDHRVCELSEETLFLPFYTFFGGLFSSPTLFAATGQQPTFSWFPFSAEQYTFPFWAYGFICGWPRPVSSRSAKQPGWRSTPIVTIVTIVWGPFWTNQMCMVCIFYSWIPNPYLLIFLQRLFGLVKRLFSSFHSDAPQRHI